MNTRIVSTLVTLCLVSVLSLASTVSAEEHAIQSGDSYSIEVELSFMEMFSYSWTSDVGIDFLIEDPVGNSYLSIEDTTSWSSVLPAITAGTYTLIWTNNAISIAHLSFDVSGTFNEVEQGITTMIWVGVIVGIIIIGVIVVVVIILVGGKKKAPTQTMMGPQPQMAAQALATGHCPTCGMQIDPNAAFCSKCGARFR